VLPYCGFWSLLCSPFYAHVYTKWRVVQPVMLLRVPLDNVCELDRFYL
jgi:hypothetical protein